MLASLGSALDPRIYYLSADGHVHELAWQGSWSHRDVTADAKGVAAMTGGGIAVMENQPNLDLRIYYVSADGQVQELAWVGGKWKQGPALGA